MKVLPFKIPKPNDNALVYQKDHELIFYNKLHQHAEIQLSYIHSGDGTLIVGDSISQYKSGDVLIIGSNIPHVFRSDSRGNQKSLMITLFFNKTSFGPLFFELEEMNSTKPFFKRSVNGFRTTSQLQGLKELFLSLEKQNKFDRCITFFSILQILSKCKYQSLSSFVYNKQYTDSEGKRMSAVMEFTMNNFQNKITLENVAEVAAMTKNAFCKYFKKRTNKTYMQFVNELRIEKACKLLVSDNEFSIISIAEQVGFQNLSNFNRQFKRLKSRTPSNFTL